MLFMRALQVATEVAQVRCLMVVPAAATILLAAACLGSESALLFSL